MGLMDKAKFWKKGDDTDDFGDLGDFGLDDKSLGGGADDLSGPLPSIDADPAAAGMHPDAPIQREEVPPTQASQDMADQFGLQPAPPAENVGGMAAPSGMSQPAASAQQAPAQPAPQAQPQPSYPPQYQQQGPDLTDLAKEIEIMHAKLDAIRSAIDTVNQRLAALERMASGDTGKPRYQW